MIASFPLYNAGMQNEEDLYDDEFDPDYKSKSQRKREMHALQDLGAELVKLSRDQLAQVPLDDDLRDVIVQTQRTKGHEALRRQMQYLGKQMRRLDDADIDAMRAALDRFSGASKAETAKLHQIEQLREQLLADDAALTHFLDAHPELDVQTLRTTIRNARRERAQQKPPKNFRELFQLIKGALERSAGLDAAQADYDAEHEQPEPENPNRW